MDQSQPQDAEVAVQITLSAEWTREGLAALRDRIHLLLEALPSELPVDASAEPPSPARQVAWDRVKANSSWERLSDNTRDYLVACARVALREDTFSVEDVASEMGVEDHATVLAYHRNVMRTARTAEPADWPLISSSRAGGRTQLSMTKGVATSLVGLAEPGKE
jgi:hypothetical protein